MTDNKKNENATTTTNKKDDALLASDTLPGKKAGKHPTVEADDWTQDFAAAFRGIAAATRKLLMVGKKAVIAKGPAVKQTVRAVGENRPLAFASEGAVAGQPMLPKIVYYGAWGLSISAIGADIYNKQDDAPEDKKFNTVLYWTAFHLPASLIVPAVIIHKIVHTVEHSVQNPKGFAKAWPPRAKAVAPVAAALLSIIPVVPVVDHSAEYIMEPTLGAYLGLKFAHHHHTANDDNNSHGEEQKPKKD